MALVDSLATPDLQAITSQVVPTGTPAPPRATGRLLSHAAGLAQLIQSVSQLYAAVGQSLIGQGGPNSLQAAIQQQLDRQGGRGVFHSMTDQAAAQKAAGLAAWEVASAASAARRGTIFRRLAMLAALSTATPEQPQLSGAPDPGAAEQQAAADVVQGQGMNVLPQIAATGHARGRAILQAGQPAVDAGRAAALDQAKANTPAGSAPAAGAAPVPGQQKPGYVQPDPNMNYIGTPEQIRDAKLGANRDTMEEVENEANKIKDQSRLSFDQSGPPLADQGQSAPDGSGAPASSGTPSPAPPITTPEQSVQAANELESSRQRDKQAAPHTAADAGKSAVSGAVTSGGAKLVPGTKQYLGVALLRSIPLASDFDYEALIYVHLHMLGYRLFPQIPFLYPYQLFGLSKGKFEEPSAIQKGALALIVLVEAMLLMLGMAIVLASYVVLLSPGVALLHVVFN